MCVACMICIHFIIFDALTRYPHTEFKNWSDSRPLCYPHYGSKALDFGRVIQVNEKEQHFMARVYAREGASGGPAIDIDGYLVGILHGVSLDISTFFMPCGVMNALKREEIEQVVNSKYLKGFETWISLECQFMRSQGETLQIESSMPNNFDAS